MDTMSSIAALSGIISAQKVGKAEAQAALQLLQSTMAVQEAISNAVASGSSIDIYV